MENKKSLAVCLAVWFSGFFGFGAIGHLIRLILKVPVTIGTFEVPLNLSVVLVVVLGALSLGLLILGCKRSCCSKE